MSDISKCNGNNCLLKNSCYRFTAIVDSLYQSYLVEQYNKKKNTCKFYWGVKNNDNK